MQLLIIASVFLVATIHVESGSCPQNFNFAGQFWQADVVFKGEPFSGVSEINIDRHGAQLISGAHQFRANPYFKDNTGRRQSEIRVFIFYTARSPCVSTFLQPGYDSYLIFARGNTTLSVPACGGIIPWSCVQMATRLILSRQN